MIVYCYECDRRVDSDYEADHFEFDEEDNMTCLIQKERDELREHYPDRGREK